jgi:selT/selW/selH-like putative selenoprotein
MSAIPTVEIIYCRLCGWGLRAGWMAQELLATFAEEIGSVILTPDASRGRFEIRVAQGTGPLPRVQRNKATRPRPDRARAIAWTLGSPLVQQRMQPKCFTIKRAMP